jgi:hypothetical protein
MADRSFDINVVGEEIKDSKGKKVGKVIASQYNSGIMMVDIEKLSKNHQLE